MLISYFSGIWFILLLSFFGTVSELLLINKKYSSVFFFLSFVGITIFSVTYVQTCSDYESYRQIYENTSIVETTSFLGIDKSYLFFGFTWDSLVGKYLNQDANYNIFSALYKTVSIVLLLILVRFFHPKWQNTITFLALFGSMHYYHIISCTIRQGLSNSFSVWLILLMIHFADSRKKYKNQSFLRYILVGALVLASIFSHWQGIPISLVIFSIFLLKQISKKFSIRSIKKLFRSRLLLITLILLIFFLIYVFPSFFTRYIILNFSQLFVADQYSTIELYTELTDGGYGQKIGFTFYIDLLLIFLSSGIMRQLSSRIEITEESHNQEYLKWLIYLSCFSLFLKALTIAGLGTLVRLIAAIYILQIFCLPSLLNQLTKKMRLILIALMSIPYLYFIFFVSYEEFMIIGL
jgi:hypothetical protein